MEKLKTVLAIGLMFGLLATAQATEVLLSAGFETGEGYTDSSDGSDEALVVGYLGDTSGGNQQGWYGEQYYNKAISTNMGVVSDDQAHSGTQSLKIPLEDYFYDYYRHPLEEKTSGTTTIQWYQYLERVDTEDGHLANNLQVELIDRFDTNGVAPGNEYAYRGPGPYFQCGTEYGAAGHSEDIYRLRTTGDPSTVEITRTGITAEGAWVGLKAVVDLDAATYDFYSDTGSGFVQETNDLKLRTWSDTDPPLLDSFSLYQLCGSNYFTGTTASYIDDISITWVPEPATIGLLLVGGLAILRRRRWKA